MFTRRNKETGVHPRRGELWLMPGDFRKDEAVPGMVGFYGIPSCFAEINEQRGESLEQDHFHQLVRSAIKTFLRDEPASVLIQDFSHGTVIPWYDQFLEMKHSALYHGGTFQEKHFENAKQYRFDFKVLPDAFFEETYQLINRDYCHESIYITYSAQTPASLNFYVDGEHPVLIIQTMPSCPIAYVADVLDSVCKQQGWRFSNHINERESS